MDEEEGSQLRREEAAVAIRLTAVDKEGFHLGSSVAGSHSLPPSCGGACERDARTGIPFLI